MKAYNTIRKKFDGDLEKALLDIVRTSSAFLLGQIENLTPYLNKISELIAQSNPKIHSVQFRDLLQAFNMCYSFYGTAISELRKMIQLIPTSLDDEEEHIIKLYREVPDSVKLKIKEHLKVHSTNKYFNENNRIDKI